MILIVLLLIVVGAALAVIIAFALVGGTALLAVSTAFIINGVRTVTRRKPKPKTYTRPPPDTSMLR